MPVESAADRAAFFNADEFAVAAVYTPPAGGGAQSVTGILDDKKLFERGADGVNMALRELRFLVLKSAFGAAPLKNGTLAIAAATYRIRAVADWEGAPDGSIYALPLAV